MERLLGRLQIGEHALRPNGERLMRAGRNRVVFLTHAARAAAAAHGAEILGTA